MFAFCLIAFGLIALVSGILTSSSKQSGMLADTDQARKVAFQISTELRNAQVGADGSYPLNVAGAQQIIFFTNADRDNTVERVRYFIQNGDLWKGVTEYNGSSYNTSTESSYVVQDNLANGSNPVFYYYDGSFTGSSTQTSLSQPVNVTGVKFVKVVLTVTNRGGVKNTNTFTVTAGAAVRNLKTNLGQ